MDTKLAARLEQIVARLGFTWRPCPRDFSSFSETQRAQHPHAHGYCQDGVITNGYESDRRVCPTCKGAGEVLK
jgi:hypothetical protein